MSKTVKNVECGRPRTGVVVKIDRDVGKRLRGRQEGQRSDMKSLGAEESHCNRIPPVLALVVRPGQSTRAIKIADSGAAPFDAPEIPSSTSYLSVSPP